MLILVFAIIIFVVYYQKKVLAQQNQIQLAENEYQRQLLKATIQVEEKERERIAKNIHDDVGTLLNVLKLTLTKLTRNTDNKELTETLSSESIHLLDESIQSVRNVAKDLVSPTLIKLGYLKATHELCKLITNSGQLFADLVYDASLAGTRFPDGTEVQLYRVTQELINNIMKHAGASELTIEYIKQEHAHLITLTHNGKGINDRDVEEISRQERGLGLKSIQSRAQLINATVHYYNEANLKPSINITLPIV